MLMSDEDRVRPCLTVTKIKIKLSRQEQSIDSLRNMRRPLFDSTCMDQRHGASLAFLPYLSTRSFYTYNNVSMS